MRNFTVAEKEIPATHADYLTHFDATIEHHLTDNQVARDFLAISKNVPPPPALPAVLRRLWRAATFAPARLQYLATVGTTPPAARRKLGLRWSTTDERALRALGQIIAHTVPLLPERLRYCPIAYEARRLERARQRLRRTLDLRPI